MGQIRDLDQMVPGESVQALITANTKRHGTAAEPAPGTWLGRLRRLVPLGRLKRVGRRNRPSLAAGALGTGTRLFSRLRRWRSVSLSAFHRTR